MGTHHDYESNDDEFNLTAEEAKVIASLQRLAKRWPNTLRLVSMDGSLHVVRADDDRFHSEDSMERVQSIIADIHGIPHEGGAW